MSQASPSASAQVAAPGHTREAERAHLPQLNRHGRLRPLTLSTAADSCSEYDRYSRRDARGALNCILAPADPAGPHRQSRSVRHASCCHPPDPPEWSPSGPASFAASASRTRAFRAGSSARTGAQDGGIARSGLPCPSESRSHRRGPMTHSGTGGLIRDLRRPGVMLGLAGRKVTG
jgi:hypothetical protein